MFLIGHAAVGAVLASATGTHNPAIAFGIGWLSHYLADFVPHGDEGVGAWTRRGNEVRRLMAIVAVDGLILLGASAAYIAANGFSWTICMAIVGSMVPDIIWGIEKLRKRPLWRPLEIFHDKNHNFFDLRMPVPAGLLLQFVVTTALWRHLIG
jgi:hypothetical protein